MKELLLLNCVSMCFTLILHQNHRVWLFFYFIFYFFLPSLIEVINTAVFSPFTVSGCCRPTTQLTVVNNSHVLIGKLHFLCPLTSSHKCKFRSLTSFHFVSLPSFLPSLPFFSFPVLHRLLPSLYPSHSTPIPPSIFFLHYISQLYRSSPVASVNIPGV